MHGDDNQAQREVKGSMNPRNHVVRRVATAILIVLFVFMLLWALIQFLILPRLPAVWQNYLVLAGLALISTTTILAGLAQVTGLSLRDFASNSREDKTTSLESSTSQLIAQVQDELYSEDSQLPHALTLCLDLCQRLSLPAEYATWLRRELGGYRHRNALAQEFGGDDRFEEWMQQWANHRLVNTYVKFQYVSAETDRLMMEDWPFEKILVGYTLPQVVEMKQSAMLPTATGQFAVSLAQLDRSKLEDLQDFIARNGLVPTSDIQVFFTVQGLTSLLNGVRAKVVSLLDEARAAQDAGDREAGHKASALASKDIREQR